MVRSDCQIDQLNPLTNRRTFLRTTGTAGMVGIAGCMSLLDDEEDGVEYWTLFGGGDGDTMEGIVDDINEDEGNELHINRQRVPWDEYYDRLYTSLTGDDYPDLAIMHADRIQEYQDLVTPLNDKIDESQYLDDLVELGKVDEELLAIPLDTLPHGIYYNKDLFEDAGLDPEDPPNNPSEFQEAATAISDNTEAWGFNYSDGGQSINTMRMMFASLTGGDNLLTDDLEPAIDGDDGLAVAEEMYGWVHEHEWTPDDTDVGDDGWLAGEVGMRSNGSWHVGELDEVDFEWGMIEPHLMANAEETYTNANSHMLIIPQSDERDEERHEETVQALQLITQDYNDRWGYEAGHLPASQIAYDSDDLRESDLWDLTLNTFYVMIEDGQGVGHSSTPNNTAYQEQLEQNLQDMRTGHISAEEMIENVSEGIRGVFE